MKIWTFATAILTPSAGVSLVYYLSGAALERGPNLAFATGCALLITALTGVIAYVNSYD